LVADGLAVTGVEVFTGGDVVIAVTDGGVGLPSNPQLAKTKDIKTKIARRTYVDFIS
jgi:hypothetical protein